MKGLPLAVVAASALLVGSAGASPAPQKTQGGAKAYSIRIVVPGQPSAGTAAVTAPPDAVALGGTFTYPADGSIASTEAVSASASTDAGVKNADATGTSEVDGLSLFAGEITASRLTVRAAAAAAPGGSSGNVKTSAIEGLIVLGQPVTVRPRGYPDRVFTGKVDLIYPHFNRETRTARLRVELVNKEDLLRPDMYVDVEIATGAAAPDLTVPESAVIDTGTRQVVLVDKSEGRFEPREIKPGRRSSGFVEVQEGVSEGEAVVVSANFLIDAESNLKAALKGFATSEQAP